MPRNQKRREEEEEEEEDIEEEAPQFAFDTEGVEKTPAQLEEGARKIIEALPAGVQKRVKFLRKLQSDHDKLQAKFEEELKALEKKYEALYNPLYSRRKEVITGASEVTEEETKQSQEYDEEAKKKLEEKKEGEQPAPTATTTAPETLPEDSKGIPNFWLHVLLKSEVNEEMIQEHDKDSLKYLVDVTCEDVELPIEGSEKKQKGFSVKFTFKENPYFTNTVLTKTYFLSGEDESTIEKSEGCTIAWKEGQDLTVTIKTKKQKHKSGKHTRTVQQALPRDSFYNFFKELKFEVDEEEDEEEAEERFEQLMDADAEIGSVFRERIIPHAVQYYLGEMETINVDEMVARMGLGGDNYDELDEEEEEEEEPQPAKKGGRGGRGGARGGRGGAQGGQGQAGQQECKQQ